MAFAPGSTLVICRLTIITDNVQPVRELHHGEGDLDELDGEEAGGRPFFCGGLLDLEDVKESDPELLLGFLAGRCAAGDRTCR